MTIKPAPFRLLPRAHMGDRLEALLRERGLTQSHLADRLNITRQAMSMKFSYDKWDADTIWAIAQALDVPTDYFFREPAATPGRVKKP